MKLFSKLLVVGVSICFVHVAYADSCSMPCPKEECPKPCPPKPCNSCPPVCFEPGYPTSPECAPCAYNLAAMYELSPCPWDFWIDASFTYWQAYQEGMSLGLSTTDISGSLQQPQNAQFLFQNTSFKPGFKVGLGLVLDHDHWSGLLEYAWFRSTTTTRSDAPVDKRGGIALWRGNTFLYGLRSTSISPSKWRCNMDLLDALLIRPYYQGTNLIIAPFGGLRAQWIRQNLNINAQTFTSLFNPTNPVNVHAKSQSWAVGPKVGFQGEWHLGWGFRLEGDAAASLLFTRYTRVSYAYSPSSDQFDPISSRFRNYDTIRVDNEFNLGVGWGSYFDCRNYHFDILVTYDFQVFWNQNMMRQLVDNIFVRTSHAPANLYLQGLTLRTQFDF